MEYLDGVRYEACGHLLQPYWKGLAAIKMLATAAKVTEQQTKYWLKKQAIWQIYLPAPRHIPRSKFDVAVPNEVHQTDLLFLPHDRVRWKTFRYALTVVDVASRFKEAEPLTSKTAAEVADGLARIYKRSPLRWPKLLQIDSGREFMGSVSQLLTLAERLFGHLYAQEMRIPSGGRSTEWANRLPSVVAALNEEVTRLNGKKPSDAIKAKILTQKPSSERPLALKEQKVPSGVGVRYLYQPGELEGGRRRATDPVWSLEMYRLGRSVSKPDEPLLFYVQGDDAPQQGFVREELLAVPSDKQLPSDRVVRR